MLDHFSYNMPTDCFSYKHASWVCGIYLHVICSTDNPSRGVHEKTQYVTLYRNSYYGQLNWDITLTQTQNIKSCWQMNILELHVSAYWYTKFAKVKSKDHNETTSSINCIYSLIQMVNYVELLIVFFVFRVVCLPLRIPDISMLKNCTWRKYNFLLQPPGARGTVPKPVNKTLPGGKLRPLQSNPRSGNDDYKNTWGDSAVSSKPRPM